MFVWKTSDIVLFNFSSSTILEIGNINSAQFIFDTDHLTNSDSWQLGGISGNLIALEVLGLAYMNRIRFSLSGQHSRASTLMSQSQWPPIKGGCVGCKRKARKDGEDLRAVQ